MSRPQLKLVLALPAALALALGSALWAAGRLHASAEPPVLGQAPEFSLRSSSGEKVNGWDLRGPWVAGFIYTHCSGQCPMMTEAMKGLGPRLSGVKLVSFSLDPADGPGTLSAFARKNGADWTLLTGREGEVRRLASEGFKLAAVPGTDPKEFITHSRYLVLVDGKGSIRGYYDSADAEALDRLVRDSQRL